MTRADRIKAFRMRIDGMSWADIGHQLGYDSSSVYRDIKNCISSPRCPSRIIYPALFKICVEQFDGSILQMSKELGISDSALRSCLFGKSRPTARIIDAVRSRFGLTYESAFAKEESQ